MSTSMLCRDGPNQPWGPLEPVPELNNPNLSQGRPFISSNGLTLLYSPFDATPLDRGGGDLGILVRSKVDAGWSKPVNLGDAINTSGSSEDYATLSSDGKTLYFSRNGQTDDSFDIWQAPVLPFENVPLEGTSTHYTQSFDEPGISSTQAGAPLPAGWTFTANDVVFNNATTRSFPTSTRAYTGVYNAGADSAADRGWSRT